MKVNDIVKFRLQFGSWIGKTGIILETGNYGTGEYARGVYGKPLDLIVMWEDGKVVPCASGDLVVVTKEEE